MDGVDEDVALLQVLLHLLAVNDDTNLVSRGGLAGLDYVNAYARKLLWEGGALAPDGVKKMAAFDDALIARHLSPGGAADLLGLTWFLAQFPTSDGDFPPMGASNRSGTQIVIGMDRFLEPDKPRWRAECARFRLARERILSGPRKCVSPLR
jgi:ATP:dephospho-CoA triphosphoribosyl transferase